MAAEGETEMDHGDAAGIRVLQMAGKANHGVDPTEVLGAAPPGVDLPGAMQLRTQEQGRRIRVGMRKNELMRQMAGETHRETEILVVPGAIHHGTMTKERRIAEDQEVGGAEMKEVMTTTGKGERHVHRTSRDSRQHQSLWPVVQAVYESTITGIGRLCVTADV